MSFQQQQRDSCEAQLNNSLLETLARLSPAEDNANLRKRETAVAILKSIVSTWMERMQKGKNADESKTKAALLTFGSYRLGVHDCQSDLDLLCVAPRSVAREEFFSSFVDVLRNNINITELQTIPEAFVPVIKMKFRSNFSVDIIFAQVLLDDIPEDIEERLLDNAILKYVDDQSVRALNGFRVASEIRRLVPNEETFKVALRVVKLWAKNHSIYSNTVGFLGGIAWAILVARTCQLHPSAAPAALLKEFFVMINTWNWPEPITLKPLPNPRTDKKVWNQARSSDLLPIITPAYPCQNSARNVSVSARTVLLMECAKAQNVVSRIEAGMATWAELLDEVNFFSRYDYFVKVECSAESSQEHNVFSELVKSKLRVLLSLLEYSNQFLMCHVNPVKLQLTPQYEQKHTENWFVGVVPDRSKGQIVCIKNQLCYFHNEVLSSVGEGNDPSRLKLDFKFFSRKQEIESIVPRAYLEKGRMDVSPRLRRKRRSSGEVRTPEKRRREENIETVARQVNTECA